MEEMRAFMRFIVAKDLYEEAKANRYSLDRRLAMLKGPAFPGDPEPSAIPQGDQDVIEEAYQLTRKVYLEARAAIWNMVKP